MVGGPLNDLIVVAGDVSLGGKLNVALSPGGSLDVGVYRVISYGGTLSNAAGLTLGALPTGADRTDYFIQTSVDKQVNLTYSNGLTLNHWDGGVGPRTTARSTAARAPGWRRAASTTIGPMSAAGSTRVGTRTPTRSSAARAARCWSTAAPMGRSTCRACNSPSTAMSCRAASGDKLSLKGSPAGSGPNEATIRVGDGTAAGAGYTATIATVLDGAVKVVKTDLGTLALSGVNTTGGTAVNNGTVQVSQDANLGAASGALSLDGGTLAATASFDTGARSRWAWATAASMSRRGQPGRDQRDQRQRRAEQGRRGYADAARGQRLCGRHDDHGRHAAAGYGRHGGAIVGDVANNGALAFNRSDTYTFGGRISGSGAVTQMGSGTTVLTADNRYTGLTTIAAGTLQWARAAPPAASSATWSTTAA